MLNYRYSNLKHALCFVRTLGIFSFHDMAEEKRYLVQQVNALRKENNVYRVEFRELKDEIKNYKELLKNSDHVNAQLRQDIRGLQHVQRANLRLTQENEQLRTDLRNLRKNHCVQSSKPYEELSDNERKTIRNKLDKFFKLCLEVRQPC